MYRTRKTKRWKWKNQRFGDRNTPSGMWVATDLCGCINGVYATTVMLTHKFSLVHFGKTLCGVKNSQFPDTRRNLYICPHFISKGTNLKATTNTLQMLRFIQSSRSQSGRLCNFKVRRYNSTLPDKDSTLSKCMLWFGYIIVDNLSNSFVKLYFHKVHYIFEILIRPPWRIK